MISVLYVDDEKSLLLLGKIFLEKHGDFSVTTIESAKEALSYLEKERVDAIVSDYQMPGMDGIAFLKVVREQYGDIPFILFTGRGREEVVIEAINNGADFYMQKGGKPEAQFAELAHKIRQAVRRKQAEQSFHKSEKLLADIINFLPDATFAIDQSGKVIAWNRAIEEMTGVSSGDMLGKGDYEYAIPFYGSRRPTCIDLITEPDEKITQFYSNVSRTGSTITAETDLPHPKGNQIRVLIKACPLYNEAGDIIGGIESIRDITELKKTELELVESESKFRNVVSYSRDCILIVGFNGNILFINQTGLLMVDEKDLDSVIGKNVMEYIHPESVEIVKHDMYQVAQGIDGYISQYKLITAKNREIWVESLGRKIPYRNSEVILTSLREITGRKQADDALKESEEKFRSLAELLPQMIFELDMNLMVTYANQIGLAMTGTTLQDVQEGINALSFIHPSQHQKIKENIQKKLTGVPLELEEYVAVRNDGSTFPINVYSSPIYQKGELTGFRGVIVDLSPRKKIEDQLRESEEKFRALVEQSLDGTVIADFTGKFLFANPRIGEIIGHPHVQGLIGTSNIFSFIMPEFHEKALHDFGLVESGVDSFLVYFQVLTVDKRTIWIECIGKKISYAGSPAILLSIHDITERKKAEDAVRESEQKMATIFMNNPVALSLVSAADGVFVDVNEAFLHNTGYARKDVIGSTSDALELFPDTDQYNRFVSLLRDQKAVYGMEIPVQLSSGDIKICRFSSSLIMMGGRPHILSSIEDVSERKAKQSAFETIVRSMVGTTGINSLQKITENISSWLQADCVMLGEIQPDKATVKVLSMLLDGQEISDFSYTLAKTPCENVAEKGFCMYPDNAVQLFPESPDLKELNIRGYIGTPLRNSKGKVIGILCVLFKNPIHPSPSVQEILDIIAVKAAAEIERTRIEQTLQESQYKLAEAMDMADIVYWEFDVGTGMFTFDDRFYALYGTTAEREGGNLMSAERYAKEFLHPGDSYIVAAETEKALKTTDPEYVSYLEHWIIRRDKEIRYISVRIGITKDKQGKTIKTHGANQDITDLKRIEEALRQANRQLTLLSNITRHDILNQTSVISGFLDIVETDCTDPVMSDYLGRMKNAVKEINSQIEFTRIYQDISSHEPRWLVLDAVIPLSPVPSVRIHTDLQDFSIYADPMLEKVFFNLLDNSLRHGERVTEIRVSTFESADALTVVWEDNGVGIPANEKELIFERGYGNNTGFGMFLVRDILSLTGITIMETGDRTGARFEIRVPQGSYRRESPSPLT